VSEIRYGLMIVGGIITAMGLGMCLLPLASRYQKWTEGFGEDLGCTLLFLPLFVFGLGVVIAGCSIGN